MLPKELKKPHDSNAAPRGQNEQIVVFRQDNFSTSSERQGQYVVILRIATVELCTHVRVDALAIPLETFNELDNGLGGDFEPRPRRDIAQLAELLGVIEKLMVQRSEFEELPRRPRG